MDLRERIKNRGIQQKRTQIRRRKYKTLRTNYTRKTTNDERQNRRNLLNYQTKLRRCSRSGLDRLDKMRNKQHENDGAIRLTKRIWIGILIKENEILVKKKRSRLCHKSKEIRIKIIISNIYKI